MEFYFRLCLYEWERNEERELSPSTKEGSRKKEVNMTSTNTALLEPDSAEHSESTRHLHVN